MNKATEQDIARALDLRSPHVNAVVAELREVKAKLAAAEQRIAELQRFEWEATRRAIEEAPITWIPALFLQIVKRSKLAWKDRASMIAAAQRAWDQA